MDSKNNFDKMSADESNLWLTVSLSNQKYAVNCDNVDSIFQLHQEVTEVPNTGCGVLGVINLRGMILPLINMRSLLGMKTLEQEQAEFEAMIRKYQGDHLKWVEELKDCLENDHEFRLPTDPHACAFGRWYDSCGKDIQVAGFTLGKIEEPHKRLHESALKCLSAKKGSGGRELADRIFKKEIKPCADQIAGYLDTFIAHSRNGYRKICVAISDGVTNLGIVVDNVHAVGRIKKEYPLDKLNRSKYVLSLGDMSDGNRAMLLNEKELFSAVNC